MPRRALLCSALSARSAAPLGHKPCMQDSRRALRSGPAALALVGCTFSAALQEQRGESVAFDMALVCAGLCSGPLDDACTNTGDFQQLCSQPPRHSAERAAHATTADTNCAQASRGLMRAQRQGPRRLGLKLRQPPTATVTIVPPSDLGACAQMALNVGGFVKEGAMRAVACLPYILPMMDSLAYGRFLFQKVPILALIFMKPLQPFIDAAQAFPVSADSMFCTTCMHTHQSLNP